ncbi:MAG: hypothetical protein R6U58_10345 [Bacteroidales bacterium]
MTNIYIFALAIFFLNIPFGYWRSGTRKFSREWYLAIHIPVPLIILLRVYCDLGWSLYSYAILITSFFLGQYTGKITRNIRNINKQKERSP